MIYEATTDQDTVMNLTNHAYFNLKGINNTSNDIDKDFSILNHIVTINANEYIDVDSELIPTGMDSSSAN
jgi:aldose 1-epimerase